VFILNQEFKKRLQKAAMRNSVLLLPSGTDWIYRTSAYPHLLIIGKKRGKNSPIFISFTIVNSPNLHRNFTWYSY